MTFRMEIKKRPCHFWQPFVKSDGYIYPCCKIWGNSNLRIGHLQDADIIERFIRYDQNCQCEGYQLCKAEPAEIHTIKLLNIEFSLKCNGDCAMCGVRAPDWSGIYDDMNYSRLSKLVDAFKPKELFVQGGEVLIQKQTLSWLKNMKSLNPEISIHIVSNGSAGLGMIEIFEKIFDSSTFSFVGFQPMTYKRIMGLNFEKTIRFVEEIIKRGNIRVSIKLLCTPNNIHEIPLFLDWGFRNKPYSILLAEMANFECYINRNTADNYWNKIIKRTGDEIKTLLIKSRDLLEENQLIIKISSFLRNEFSIDDTFVNKHRLFTLVPYF